MKKKGLKIKELSEELGVKARDVLSRCHREGISAQNTASRLHPRDVERVRQWFSKDEPSSPEPIAD